MQTSPAVRAPYPIAFDSALRARMNAAFDFDFAGVTLKASDLPCRYGARAVTFGSEIHFAPNAWSCESRDFLALLAHELAHVVQQASGRVDGRMGTTALYVDPALEAEADRAATLLAAGRDAEVGSALGRRRRALAAAVGGTTRVLQPKLVIEDSALYNGGAKNALGMLTAQIPDALVFTQIKEGLDVSPGKSFDTAKGRLPKSATLLERVMTTAHWITVRQGGNATAPAMWTKDSMWAAIRGQQGFLKKVTTPGRGASSTITWNGGDEACSDFDPREGHILMETVPTHIMLAHELIHADRISRGTFALGSSKTTYLIDTRHGEDCKEYTNNGWKYVANAAEWAGLKGGGWVAEDIVMSDDIANCGFLDLENKTGRDPLLITENEIRREFGIKLRAKYGSFRQRLKSPQVK